MRTLSLALIGTWLVAPLPTFAAITLPSVISDHMVLQQKLPVTILGWADSNKTITVSLGTQRHDTKADATGAWKVKLRPLAASAIASEDKAFVEATAEIVENTVVVSSTHVAKPVAVRFAWDQVAMPNLMNKEGLPAAPFRTDTW